MSARPAFAQVSAAEGLEVRVHNCAHVSEAGLVELLTLELLTLGRDRAPEPVEVRVDCAPDAMILSAQVRERPPLTRRLLGDPSEVSERKVSLAVSELVSDLWADSPPKAEPAVPPQKAPVTEHTPKSPPPRRFTVQAGVDVTRFTAPDRAAASGSLSATFAALPSLEVGGRLSLSVSGVDVELAEIRQTLGTLAPLVHFVRPAPRLSFFCGLALPVGFVRLSPTTTKANAEPSAVSGPLLAVQGEAGLRWKVGRRIFVQGGGFVGGVLVPVVGTLGEDPLVSVDGLLAGGQFGVGAFF